MKFALTIIALLGLPVAVNAQNTPSKNALVPILAPEVGNKACYARTYDAAHLKAHPRQRITAMMFMMRVHAYDPVPATAARPEDKVYYPFAMSIARRGEKRVMETAGDCMGADGISCVVDCDGGGLELDKSSTADALIVRLTNDGIRMFHNCEDKPGPLVKAAGDDKVFRLDKVAPGVCAALEKKYLDY